MAIEWFKKQKAKNEQLVDNVINFTEILEKRELGCCGSCRDYENGRGEWCEGCILYENVYRDDFEEEQCRIFQFPCQTPIPHS